MRATARISRLLIAGITLLALASATLLLYLNAVPDRYTYAVGDISTQDIVAPRSIVDRAATEEAARNARAAVEILWVRSESISREGLDRIEQVMSVVSEARDRRTEINPETGMPISVQARAADATLTLQQDVGVNLDMDTVVRLLTVEDASFRNIENNTYFLGESLMSDMMDSARLELSIAQRTSDLEERTSQYQEDIPLVRLLLTELLRPNAVMDEVATENARLAAYENALANPVEIERGAFVVQRGQQITADIHERLRELNLLDSSTVNTALLAGVLLHVLVIFGIGWAFLHNHARDQLSYFGNRVTLFLALAIPFLLSLYTLRLSPLAIPTAFAAVVLCAYFGLRMSIVMTTLLTVMLLPATGYDVQMLLVSLTGSYTAALFARGISRRDSYAHIILVTALAGLATVSAYSLVFQTGWDALVRDATFALLASSLSVISAVGLLPVFEMLLNTVSPMRLIELSQTGNILLRRLFIEAPGTSQHSMMVANLAESAAEAIHANALLARVGAYYHDIGKLENPHMFIENQQGDNPHDRLPAEQSAAIITAHPELGVRIGKKYRLPPALLKIIHEHHGTTIQSYFLHKARQEAEQAGQPPPDESHFRYPGPVPTSRESSLIMLADSVEAAVKATGASGLKDVESLIRRIVKNKNEQDQLIHSGLSYREVEQAIRAFLQVYAGHFHERIEYPDDRSVRQSAAKVSG